MASPFWTFCQFCCWTASNSIFTKSGIPGRQWTRVDNYRFSSRSIPGFPLRCKLTRLLDFRRAGPNCSSIAFDKPVLLRSKWRSLKLSFMKFVTFCMSFLSLGLSAIGFYLLGYCLFAFSSFISASLSLTLYSSKFNCFSLTFRRLFHDKFRYCSLLLATKESLS